MSRLGPTLVLLSLCSGLIGCTVHRHYGRPYAYGVHSTDWVIEEQSQACAATCGHLSGDARFLCMSRCPGFVTAQVATCRDVPDWHECRIAYEVPTPTPVRRDTSDDPPLGDGQLGTAVAVGTVRVLGAVISAALQAEANDECSTTEEKKARERPPAPHTPRAVKRRAAEDKKPAAAPTKKKKRPFLRP